MSKYTRILIATTLTLGLVGPLSMATSFAQAPAASAASTTAGTVNGTVRDTSGAPIANATVSLVGVENLRSTSDIHGNFSFANVTPGIYSFTASKPGYNPASENSVTVLSGQISTLAVVISPISFSSLRTIASVRSVGRGTFNTTPGSVNIITSQTFQDQAQPQVMKILNETPGVVASLPQTSANGAAPGAITFPNIRGALSFETASLIDGHPVSVGSFGDYVTTFLNPFMLQTVEVVKGPGADAPEVNYAIGGTVNFLTKDPTFQPSGILQVGVDNWGSSIFNFGLADTVGRLGYALAFGSNDLESSVSNTSTMVSPQTPQQGILNFNGTTGVPINFNDLFPTPAIPGTISTNENTYYLVACCQKVGSDLYFNKSELVKLRYRLSSATHATFTYVGSQTRTNQTANTGDIAHSTFTLTGSGASAGQIASYSGSIPNNAPLDIGFVRTPEFEINNEPILEGEIGTTLRNDTLLARYYSAGIHRLLYQGGTNPFGPTVIGMQLYGYDANTKSIYNGQTMPVTFYDYFNQAEDDVLKGWSFEWDHPFNETNALTFTFDTTHSTTTSYSIGANGPSGSSTSFNVSSLSTSESVTLPTGSYQNFSTAMLRAFFQPNPKLSITFSNYFNIYTSRVPTQCLAIAVPFKGRCNFDGSGSIGPFNQSQSMGSNTCNVTACGTSLGAPVPGFAFGTTTTSHYDPRLALEFRPDPSTAVRFSAGSAIAPPYLAELTTVPGAISCSSFGCPAGSFATEQLQSGNLKPETAFGYDLGADHRFRDGVTFLTGDFYFENLFNHFITNLYPSGTTCPAIDPNTNSPTPANCASNALPLFFKQNINVSNARFEGIELALRRVPAQGLGYTIQGALQRGYAYNLPGCFYGVTTTGACAFKTNLAVIPGQNFTGGGINGNVSGVSVNGFSNQNLPYAQGFGDLNWRTLSGWYGSVNMTYYGNNNSLNQHAFTVLAATLRAPLGNNLSFQVSGDNLTNQYTGIWPVFGGGLFTPLATGQFAATQANLLPSRTFRFLLTKKFGTGNTP